MNIQEGARVSHKDKTVNNGLVMPVIKINDDKKEALCSLEGPDQWFKIDDLTVIEEAEPPFKNPGE